EHSVVDTQRYEMLHIRGGWRDFLQIASVLIRAKQLAWIRKAALIRPVQDIATDEDVARPNAFISDHFGRTALEWHPHDPPHCRWCCVSPLTPVHIAPIARYGVDR